MTSPRIIAQIDAPTEPGLCEAIGCDRLPHHTDAIHGECEEAAKSAESPWILAAEVIIAIIAIIVVCHERGDAICRGLGL